MYKYSESSAKKLRSCHPDLQAVFEKVINHIDCTIIEGHREKYRQNHLFATKFSKVKWPDGKHNTKPSNALDSAPCPIRWSDRERFFFFAGLVKGIAASMGIKIRWGGDWDSDNDFKDQRFDDLIHFELL